jgi:transcriptional regulator with XRE-family HTH domain
MGSAFKTPEEIQHNLARRVRELRLSRNITREEITRRTAVSTQAIQNLETTGKASVETLVRVLNVLGTDCSEVIPLPTGSSVDPIEVFNNSKPRQRARSR